MRHCLNPFVASLSGLLVLISSGGASAAALPMAVTDEPSRVAAIAAAADAPLLYAVGLPPSLAEIAGSSGGVNVFSAGAHTLSMRLRAHDWPAHVPLYWQSEALEHPHVIHALDGEALWLPDVPGDLATLTWSGDAVPERASVTLELVYHGYRDLQHFTAKAAGDSGTCNIDVACSQANSWDSPVRATTFITIGSGTTRGLCSASLLNNTANDNRPLLITARHCGVTPGNGRSLNTVFNFQRSTCGGANDGNSMRDVISGSTWLAESVSADTTLVVLSNAVPRAFNAQFGAWSAIPVAPVSGAGVHHPSGDQKKISLFDTTALTSNDARITGGGLLGGGGFNVDAWGVRWRQGTTERGSSGSGLWNQDRALVGVLSGGGSSCEPQDRDEIDLYGRLAVAWDESAGIRNALDPVSGGTSRTSSGRAASGSAAAGSGGDSGGGSFGGLSLLMLTLLGALRRLRTVPRTD